MESVRPATGAPELVLDPDATVFQPLTVAIYRDDARPQVVVVLSRWQPTDDERAAVAAGEDVYVAQLTETNAVSALRVSIGPAGYEVDPAQLVSTEPEYGAAGNEGPPTDSEGAE